MQFTNVSNVLTKAQAGSFEYVKQSMNLTFWPYIQEETRCANASRTKNEQVPYSDKEYFTRQRIYKD